MAEGKHGTMHRRRIIIVCLAFLTTCILSACSLGGAAKTAVSGADPGLQASLWPAAAAEFTVGTSRTDAYPVDPLFSAFYEILGGSETFGPAISPLIVEGHIRKQYVERALLVFDESAPRNNRFALGALGSAYLQAQVETSKESAQALAPGANSPVSPLFAQKYEDLGGVRFVGSPITGLRHNAQKQRSEQLFENLGFFKLDSEPSNLIHLMALGAYNCNYACRQVQAAAAIPARGADLPAPFQRRVQQLGYAFTGPVLSGPHITAGGDQEVIFENLVLTSGAAGQEAARAKPVTEQLGFARQPLVSPNSSGMYVFYEIENGKGFNVPKLFNDYLGRYGGVEFAGIPTGEVFQQENGLYCQCFSNLCLEFDPRREPGTQLALLPIGARYKALIHDKDEDFSEQSSDDIDLIAWAEPKAVDSHDSVEVFVFAGEAGYPLNNREPRLSVQLPDGRKLERRFPPTEANGRTMLRLDPISAPTGTLVIYEVCLEAFGGAGNCVEQSYLIWNSE